MDLLHRFFKGQTDITYLIVPQKLRTMSFVPIMITTMWWLSIKTSLGHECIGQWIAGIDTLATYGDVTLKGNDRSVVFFTSCSNEDFQNIVHVYAVLVISFNRSLWRRDTHSTVWLGHQWTINCASDWRLSVFWYIWRVAFHLFSEWLLDIGCMSIWLHPK